MIVMQYLVIVEKGETGYGAYVPDLPCCIAAADSRDEVVTLIRDAIRFHIDELKADGEPIPEPASQGELVDVQAA
jgi:predicted RNase H-like HicB family nuclease